jgi:cell division protein FtsQ
LTVRKHGYAEPEAELSSSGAQQRLALEPDLDDRMLDLDVAGPSPFLRAQKRIPVRRGALPKKTVARIRTGIVIAVFCAGAFFIAAEIYDYSQHSWRFRVASSDAVLINGNQNVSRSQIMSVFGADIGRNIFFVPLDARKAQLEQIAWIESASVMRLLPNRVAVEVRERTPIAFVQIGGRIQLIDSDGVLLDVPSNHNAHYSFPVIVGMKEPEAEPRSVRAARMRIYSAIIQDLDSDGGRYSEDVSEINVSDPDDAKVTVADDVGAVLVHLGNANYLERFKTFKAHVQSWRQQFPKLDSVDLRFDREVVLNPDRVTEAAAAPPPPRTGLPYVKAAQFIPRAKPHRSAPASHVSHAKHKPIRPPARAWHAPRH